MGWHNVLQAFAKTRQPYSLVTIFFSSLTSEIFFKAGKRGRKDAPSYAARVQILAPSPLLKHLQIAFLLNFHLLENSHIRSRDEGEWFALGIPLSTHVIAVENGLDLKDHKGVWCSSYILQQKNWENSHCSCVFAFSITHMKQAMPCQFGTSSVLPWCTHAVPLLLVCVGRGWAGMGEKWHL